MILTEINGKAMKTSQSLFLLIAFLAIVGCQKEQAQHLSSTTSMAKQSTWGICCYWDLITKSCPSTYAYNCFDPIIVYPNNEYLDNLIESIGDGADGVADFFTTGGWQHLFPDLDADEGDNINIEYLEKLQSGLYSMLLSVTGNTYSFLAGPEGEFGIDDPEFVLVVLESE